MLAILENQDYEELANEVQQIASTKSEDSLYEILGNAIYDSGLEISPIGFPEATMFRIRIKNSQKFNLIKTMDFVQNSAPLTKEEAKKEGKSLFQRIKKEICTNEKIKEFFTGESALRDYLKTIIPIILAIISSSLTLGPIGLAIAVAILALLIKVGYQAYCDI